MFAMMGGQEWYIERESARFLGRIDVKFKVLMKCMFQVITDLFALLTICCRRCICCSVFTICGSVQSFAGLLFTLGLVAYPAGWGSQVISTVCHRLILMLMDGVCSLSCIRFTEILRRRVRPVHAWR